MSERPAQAGLFPVFTGVPLNAARPQLLLRRPSSSQTPSDASLCIRSAKPIARRKACALGASRNPSPRRRRQVSSVPLLVLSKLQTLRWFAIWFRLSCQKKWAKRGAGCGSDYTASHRMSPVEECCGQHTKISLQIYTTAPPAWNNAPIGSSFHAGRWQNTLP